MEKCPHQTHKATRTLQLSEINDSVCLDKLTKTSMKHNICARSNILLNQAVFQTRPTSWMGDTTYLQNV